MVIYRGINCLFDLGVSPAPKPSQRNNHTWLRYKKSTQKTLHRKIQPTSSIDNCRWFPSWKRRLPLKNRVFLNLPKGITIFKGLAFLASGRAPTIFHVHWVFHWGTGISQPFPIIFPPTSRVANRSDLWSLPSWPSPYRVVAPRTTVAPPRGSREGHSRHRDAALVLKLPSFVGGYIDIQCLVLHWLFTGRWLQISSILDEEEWGLLCLWSDLVKTGLDTLPYHGQKMHVYPVYHPQNTSKCI